MLAAGRSIPTSVGTTQLVAMTASPAYAPSPRAWGNRPNAGRNEYSYGPSPRAWENVVITTGRRRAPVHPHERGDNPRGLTLGPRTSGPSPRAWGQRDNGAVSGHAVPVHPHERGDNAGVICTSDFGFVHPRRAWGRRERIRAPFEPVGPSPRAWGDDRVGRPPGPLAVHPHERGDNCRFAPSS